MAKTATTFITTTEERLGQLPISNGQLIFIRDSRKICFDYKEERIEYGHIIVLTDEKHRLSIAKPFNTFYFVLDTQILWHFNKGEWSPLNEKPKERVIFVGSSDLPKVGEQGVLYATTTDIYTWDGSGYAKMGALRWEQF